MKATAEELKMLLEHGITETAEGRTPGRFRLVTLNFQANGGDDYPYGELSDSDRYNLY